MSNQSNWNFSQKYSGVLFIVFGMVLFLIPLVLESTQIYLSKNNVKLIVGVLVLASALIVIILTERAIKRKFKEENKY